MRIYVDERFASDEWMVQSLKKIRNRVMNKFNLDTLTYSYTLTPTGYENFAVRKPSELSDQVIAELERLTKCLY